MHPLIERATFPECIDSTMLSAFVKCPSYFYLRYVLGLEKTVQEPSATTGRDWGSIWHEVSDTLQRTGDPSQALARIEPWPDSIDPIIDRHGRSKDRMVRIFLDYLEKYEADSQRFEILRDEQYFRIEIPLSDGRSFEWCGRLDRIARNRETGNIFVWERKTTSYLTSIYFDQHEFGFQIPGYINAARLISTEDIRLCMLDVLHTLKNEHKHLRKTFRYDEPRLAEWRENVWGILQQMYRLRDSHLHEPEAWSKHWNRCHDYFKACEFADVHLLASDPTSRLRILESEYHERRWDPADLHREDA